MLLRNIQESDIAFVYSTWLKGLRYGNDTFKQMKADTFFKHYEAVLDSYFKRPYFKVVIACLKDDPDIILGWAATEKDIVHFAFVKKAWRQQGILNSMLQNYVIHNCTHLTKIGNAIRLLKAIEFNPFL